MMAVDVITGDQIRPGRAVPLIDPWLYLSTTPVRSHDVLPDGSLVAILEGDAEADGATVSPNEQARRLARVGEIHIVLNFLEQLRRRRTP
jgi:hypothetical protein